MDFSTCHKTVTTVTDRDEESNQGNPQQTDEGEQTTDGDETTPTITLRRRRFLALVGGTTGIGYLAASGREQWCQASVPPDLVEGETNFWLTDDQLQQRPINTLSLPGTHHASFPEMTDNDLPAGLLTNRAVRRWTKPQSQDVGTQLADGIRYLDVRPRYDDDGGERFWGHHNFARGAALSELFGDVADFLEQADETTTGNELVIIKLSHIEGFDSEDHREAFESFLDEQLGSHALALPDYDPDTLLSRPLSSFDQSRVAILYEGTNPWPGVADERERWLRDGWVDKPGLDEAHAAALDHTHTDQSRLGEIGYYITPTYTRIALGVLTGWLPFSSRWLEYEGLEDAATRMADRFPCFFSHLVTDPRLNPNVLTVDFYELTDVVTACRYLSYVGLHGEDQEDTGTPNSLDPN